MDLRSFTDTELDGLRVEVLTEQERRAAQAAIPGQVADLARKFAEGGGDARALADALDLDS